MLQQRCSIDSIVISQLLIKRYSMKSQPETTELELRILHDLADHDNFLVLRICHILDDQKFIKDCYFLNTDKKAFFAAESAP